MFISTHCTFFNHDFGLLYVWIILYHLSIHPSIHPPTHLLSYRNNSFCSISLVSACSYYVSYWSLIEKSTAQASVSFPMFPSGCLSVSALTLRSPTYRIDFFFPQGRVQGSCLTRIPTLATLSVKESLSPNVCFWRLSQESDGGSCIDLFLGPLFQFCLSAFGLVPCWFVTVALLALLSSSKILFVLVLWEYLWDL